MEIIIIYDNKLRLFMQIYIFTNIVREMNHK